MSADELDAICALHARAEELFQKGHMARAAEKRGEAVEAAEALGFTDCLITAFLRAEEGRDLMAHTCMPGVHRTDSQVSAMRAMALLMEVKETVQRRKAAGTLFAGACRPVEEAWNGLRLQQRMKHADARGTPQLWKVPFIGYEAYLNAGSLAVQFAKVLCDRDFVDFAVSAADLLVQPAPAQHPFLDPLSAEISFAIELKSTKGVLALVKDPTVIQPLVDAWARLQRSRVFRERHIEVYSKVMLLSGNARFEEIVAARAAAVMRACALPECGAREVDEAQFKKCAACQDVVYCSKQCQEQHWPAHKAACKAARKAAAQGGAGPSSGA
jgi:hypothetical protein